MIMIKLAKKYIFHLWLKLQPDKEKIFTKYYKENFWKNNESRSGEGSTLEQTERLRSQLPVFIEKYSIKIIFDAPCGDFNWMKHVKRDIIEYIGADIVRPLVDENNSRYADKRTHFLHLDITKDEFPMADVWICRDLLFHLSENDIYRSLDNFLSSGIPWILTTTFTEHPINENVPTGSFRLINLEISPFNFPPPVEYLVDSVPSWQKRCLGLWNREQVKEALAMRFHS